MNFSFINHKRTALIIGVLLAGVSILISISIGMEVNVLSDFTVFWQAGRNFIDNMPLYANIGGARRYIYPPFASMCFQLFAIVSLHQAAVIFSVCNCLFWALTVYYTRKILLLTSATVKQVNYSLLIGFVLSFRYFWYHLSFVQVNSLVFLLTLSGIYYFLLKKNNLAIPLLVMATFIKIIPILILIWVLSKSNYAAYLRTALYFVLCITLPILFRGFHQGINDLQDYYITFLQPFKDGRVEPELQNYGLAAALFKLFSYTPDGDTYHYIITILSTSTIMILYKSILIFSFIAFLLLLIYSRFVAKSISLLEIGFTLLFTHLLSGITWEYHLVTLFFIIPILFLNFLTASATYKWLYYILGAFLIFNSIIGADTVGFYLYYKSCGYSLLTWMLLFLELYFLFVYFFVKKGSMEIKTPYYHKKIPVG
ncbi:MAG: glycosyltransferase 87 family protein [Bacteroidia bacterium]